MNQTAIIGLRPAELEWLKALVELLRHKDPVVVELTKQAIGYLEVVAERSDASQRGNTQLSLAKS